MKSSSRLGSLAYAWRLTNWALGRGVCIYTYPGCTVSIRDAWAPSLSLGGRCGVPGRRGVRSDVSFQSQCGGGAPVPWHLQSVFRFCAVPCGRWRQLSGRLSQSIGGCLSISALLLLCTEYSTPCFISSQTSTRQLLIKDCISSLVACKNPPLAILAIFNSRRTLDCSSCTWPPCLAIVVDMLITYKKSVAASTNEIRLLPLPYTLPEHARGCLKPVLSTLGDTYH